MTDTTKLIESLRAVTFPPRGDERYTPHAEEVARLCWEAADAMDAMLVETGRLVDALQLADATLRGANMNRNVVERKVKAALAAQPSDAEVSDG